MADDAPPLLVAAGQIAGHVGDGQQRDIEGVAAADEAAGLVGRVHVQAARHDLGLVGDDAHGPAAQPGQGGDDVLGKVVVRLEEVAVVDDGPDDVVHVVGGAGAVRDDGVQGRLLPVGRDRRRAPAAGLPCCCRAESSGAF